MQVVLLAAGQSSRFYPFSGEGHKSQFQLLGKSIIEHTLLSLQKAGISDIVIITSKGSTISDSIPQSLHNSLALTFVQQNEPRGMGDALLSAKDVLKEHFFVSHAHHVDIGDFIHPMHEKQKAGADVVLLGKEEERVSDFGVLKIDGDTVLDIIEKPQEGNAPSNVRVIGIYLLSKQFVQTLETASIHHYNFEEALGMFAKQHTVKVSMAKNPCTTLKYPWDLLSINEYLLKNTTAHVSDNVAIHESAVVSSDAIIEENVKVLEGAVIKGPCFIGKNVTIGNHAILRDFVSVEEGAVIGAHLEVKNSIVGVSSTTHSGFIGNSVIGAHCKIPAGFTTGNVRLDRSTITVQTAKGDVNTGQKFLGVFMGDEVRLGIKVSTMPGILIGKGSIIGPGTTVFHNIDEETLFYTKFAEVIEKKTDASKIERLLQKEESEKIVLFDIDYTLFDTDQFKQSELTEYHLYPEVLQVLKKISTFATLGIFSEGELEFQMGKLLKTEIVKHFHNDSLSIVAKKEDELASVLERVSSKTIFLVDDKLSVLYHAKLHSPSIYSIWVRRGPYALNQEAIDGFMPDATVESLSEVVPIIANTE